MYLERMIHVGVTVVSKMAIILVVMRANKKFIVRNPNATLMISSIGVATNNASEARDSVLQMDHL